MDNKNYDIEILDTTLRDGSQGEGINFSLRDKIAVTQTLDELGVAWIEAGNPGSNPKDLEFFNTFTSELKNAKLCAFSPTRKKGIKASDDSNLTLLLNHKAKTEGAVVFGKSWDLHVKEVLMASLQENLDMISETIEFLKSEGLTVIFDAEHFFDGWAANSSYALSTIKSAEGADRIVLCDTNGGSFPDRIASAVQDAVKAFPEMIFGIHAHNDCGLALANTITAVKAGCAHVQGTLAGFGERCGNTSLAALIPSLELKLNLRCLPQGSLVRIGELTRRVAEIANVTISDDMPYIGTHAFSHKGGMHTDGVLKTSVSFEHVNPAAVGNDRHLLMSEVGGRAAIAQRVKKIEPDVHKDHPVIISLAEKLKKLEAEGWAYEGADASFEILILRELGRYTPLFAIEAYRVMSEHPAGDKIECSYAWVKVLVGDKSEVAAAEGVGPVGALDSALRRALTCFFPGLAKVRLEDYKVRVIDGKDATSARVRVLIETTDGQRSWNTVGVSADIIDASRAALVDSIEYMLIKSDENEVKNEKCREILAS